MSLTPELAKLRDEIRGHAEDFGLDFFEVIFEMVDYDQMNSLAAFGGFPVRYPHWRFGMDYDQLSKGYTWGLQKIYEMVINTDPSYAYLMKNNPLVDQKLVMSHVYGHVDFFKNNYWFSKTNRRMLDTMANHAVRIRRYMDRFGQDRVETFIDHCLSIENLIDPQLPFQVQKRSESKRDDDVETPVGTPGKLKTDRSYMDAFINPATYMEEQKKKLQEDHKKAKKFPNESQKDILLFLMEQAPLETWESDVLAIIREEAYYYLPQMQTKIMNEGWASYWHSRIMTEKALKASEIIDFADQHAQTMAIQPGKLNPYKLGLELFRDIEDRWNRGKFGKDYEECEDLVAKEKWDKKLGLGKQKIFEVRRVCNDITFIDSYLTREFVERSKLFTFEFNRRTNQFEISDRDFKKVKEKLLFSLTNMGQPFIVIKDGNYENRGELLLHHQHQGIDLDMKWSKETLANVSAIWRRPVNIETEVEGQKKVLSFKDGEFAEKALG